VKRAEAEAIFDAGRDAVVELLLKFDARITELEARLKSDSTNSSKSPSSDGLSKRAAQPRVRGVRAPHEGQCLMQVVDPDVVIEHRPDACESCGEQLDPAALVQTETRQVADLPPIRLRWVEHRSQRLQCSCGHVTAGEFPEGVNAPTQYGPGMQAAAAYLCGYQHVPYDRSRQLFEDLLGASVSTGWIANAVAGVSDATIPVVELIADAISGADVAHFDETGARVDGRLHWVHVACTDDLAHFDVHTKRGSVAMDDIGILPEFRGVAMHDGLASYRQFDKATHALCGAHHLRELAGVAELYEQPWAAELAELLIEIKTRVEHARPAALGAREQRRFRRRYDKIVRIGRAANPPPPPTGQRGRPALGKPGSLAKRLDEHADAALRFMTDPRVPFDNNHAERDIRMIKVQQKISGGYRTFPGAQRGMDLRSYITTARKRGYAVITALRAAAEGYPLTFELT
jgi:transposase